jgi:hypothetical protein
MEEREARKTEDIGEGKVFVEKCGRAWKTGTRATAMKSHMCDKEYGHQGGHQCSCGSVR